MKREPGLEPPAAPGARGLAEDSTAFAAMRIPMGGASAASRRTTPPCEPKDFLSSPSGTVAPVFPESHGDRGAGHAAQARLKASFAGMRAQEKRTSGKM